MSARMPENAHNVYGRHLRRIVKKVRALPLSEHRAACVCKR